ncbi:hypothetical protein ONE63_011066 [Megalurothrips usitatus]|uniref:C2H2-type domain-containing protein n=1 Tax=Megalurothrips usitatus TaxID=439358 RepID=A0AAV7XJ38_9NEOP|nr:hypothetical protein ONE63_011066 [Megalurothrips usitatus]
MSVAPKHVLASYPISYDNPGDSLTIIGDWSWFRRLLCGARSGGRRRGRPRRVPRASSRGGGRSRLLRNPFSLFALPAWYSRDDEDGGADAAEDDGYVLPVEAVLGTSGSKAAETEEGPATDSEVDSDVDAVPLAARLKAKGRKSDGRKVANVSLEDQRDLDRGVGEDRGAVPDGGDLPDLGDHPNHGDLPDRGDDSGHGGRLDVPAGPFRCTECGALLQTLPAIVAHLKTHAGMFACNLCGKTLGCKSSLERHRLVHSQQRPHACELCDARYKHRCHLVEHRKRAH